jgi:hypothetical protein
MVAFAAAAKESAESNNDITSHVPFSPRAVVRRRCPFSW